MADKKRDRPSTRERRVKSAIARLSPPPAPSDARDMDKLLKKMTKERVNSAKANKTKHTSSTGVFAAKPAKGETQEDRKKRFATRYSLDFDGTYMPPPDLRPTSPTRRNNPHPSQQFMKWKIPSREIGVVPYEEGLDLPPEYLARDENFDAIDDLRRNFGDLKLPPAQASSTEYGAYMRRNPSRQGGPRPMARPADNEMIQRVVTGGNEAALHEWMTNATPEEQTVVYKMLKRAEEEKVKKTISTVMQPEAARAIRGWLKDADEEEKDVAVRLFSSLGARPGRPRSRSVGQAPLERPPSRRPVPPAMPPPARPSGSAMGSRQRKISVEEQPTGQKYNPWPAGVWHHKPVRDPPPQVYHRGSLFGTVREDASHFNIHPEWQDYFGSGDPVH